MPKRQQHKVILVCQECLSRNYTVNKSNLTQKERLELMKYCPTCNKRTLHKESR